MQPTGISTVQLRPGRKQGNFVMKNLGISFFSSIAGVLAVAMIIVMVPATEVVADDFCWKNSYGRGAGHVPKTCAPGEDKIGALCYAKCGPGFKRFGFDCHSTCPAGFRSEGLFCHKEAKRYNRGGGSSAKKHCEKRHGGGNCEHRAGLWYAKCRPGFVHSGVYCLPERPNCAAIGMKKGLAGRLGCAKHIKIGKPRTGQCAPGESKNAGLCYKNCRAGFKGAGPVCWMEKPRGWVNCGMGAARSKKVCGGIIFDQVTSVGSVALEVATLGSSAAVTDAAETPEKAEKLAQLRKQYADMKEAWAAIKENEKVKKGMDAADKLYEGEENVRTLVGADQDAESAVTPEDMARVAAAIASIVDPTGVSGIAASYTYPKCSKLFK